MIAGVVRNGEARLRLRIRGPRGRQQIITAVIDTGFNGYLTLPPTVIAALRLAWHSSADGVLADGSESLMEVYYATIVWDRRVRRIPVHAMDAAPLLGMALLRGHELTIQVRPGGKVTVAAFS